MGDWSGLTVVVGKIISIWRRKRNDEGHSIGIIRRNLFWRGWPSHTISCRTCKTESCKLIEVKASSFSSALLFSPSSHVVGHGNCSSIPLSFRVRVCGLHTTGEGAVFYSNISRQRSWRSNSNSSLLYPSNLQIRPHVTCFSATCHL